MLWNISIDKDGDFILSEQGTVGIKFKSHFEDDNPCAHCDMVRLGETVNKGLNNVHMKTGKICPKSRQEVSNAPLIIIQAQHRLGIGEEAPHPSAVNILVCNLFSYSIGVNALVAKIAQHRLAIKKKNNRRRLTC